MSNLKHLHQLLQARSETSTYAHKIANQLIKDLEIQNGFGLASFLEVDTNFDNFTATRVWLQKQVGGQVVEDIDYNELKEQLFNSLPDIA